MEASEPPPQNDVSHFLSKKIFGMITRRPLFSNSGRFLWLYQFFFVLLLRQKQ